MKTRRRVLVEMQRDHINSVWKALGDPVRRDILDLLSEEPLTTSQICDAFGGMTRFRVMNHMSMLRDAGLTRVQKRGRERINSVDARPLKDAYDNWFRKYEIEWAGRMSRLKRHVEDKVKKDDRMETPPQAELTRMVIDRVIDIEAPPSTVFRGLTDDLGDWFGAPYLQTDDDAIDFVLDARPGGQLVEVTRAGGGAVWANVQEIRRDQVLALEGRLGMRPAVFGRAVFTLTRKTENVTQLGFDLDSFGYFTAVEIENYTDGWRDIVETRLKHYCETGEKSGIRSTS